MQCFKLRKFLPFLILIGLAFVAGGTTLFSEAIQTNVVEVFEEYKALLKPMLGDIYLGLVLLTFLYALSDPIKTLVEKILSATDADPRGKRIVRRASRLVYWLIVILVGVSFIAPAFLGQIVLGLGLFTAALTLALKGLANDFIAGVMLSFSPKLRVGDQIELVGLAVKGTVVDIGYVQTIVNGESDERITVPNRELWARAVKTATEAEEAEQPQD